MANLNQNTFTANDQTKGQFVTAGMTGDEQRQPKPTIAEKAEKERQLKWAIRANVVYHFFAYRYFDQSSTCLDLLNFSDADIDSFNLTANKTRGLDNWHVCAEYLKKLDSPTPETNTHRRKFIHHVHSFNRTQPAHFRFYLRNLTADDVEYIEGLCKQEKTTADGEGKKIMKLIWATSCIEDEVSVDIQREELGGTDTTDHTEAAIEKCLQDRYMKLQAKVPSYTTMRAEEDAENA